MAKTVKLSDAQARKLSEPGRHCVDSSIRLYLDIKPSGAKSWMVRHESTMRKLADYHALSLANARAALSRQSHSLAAATFKEAAEDYITLKSPSWRGKKSEGQWRQSLETYVYPYIGKIPCDAVQHGHVLKVASPLWRDKPETCRRVVQRIGAVLAYEHRRLHIPYIDPTDGLALTLGKQPANIKSHPAPTIGQLKAALAAFSGDYPTHRCFRFMVYTIARSGEARNALADEIEGGVWEIPGEKMKVGKAHRVPLTASALSCLSFKKNGYLKDGLLFDNKDRPLSDMAISMLLRKANLPFVPHGIRACFRSWCAESGVDFQVAELCLAHVQKNKVVAAYQRSDLFDKRRAVLEAWEATLND